MMIQSTSSRTWLSVAALFLCCSVSQVTADCLANPSLEAEFESIVGTESLPLEGSCCQFDVCGIPCPAPVSTPSIGHGLAVAFSIVLSFVIGALCYFFVQGEAENYFVAGKSLPLWIVAMTLGAQAVDSNSLLGNVDLSYRYHFFDGAVIPIGLGLSLILNGLLLAGKINAEENVLTLPDVLAKRYGKIVEVMVGLVSITSFLMLLAGNLVGMGRISAYVWGINETIAIWVSAIIVWTYTVTGGLFSVTYTDVVQGAFGWSGCIVCCYWLIANAEHAAPPPSVGFPGYTYPNQEICDMYDGVPCDYSDGCCYNTAKWCTDPSDSSTCSAIDNGAYPIGDQSVFGTQMTDPLVLSPFPNAILWNWATIFILGFGNLAALDFQVRCMASINPRTAKYGCLIGGCFTIFIGVPFAYLGAITRYYYGPDSIHAEFSADTCSRILGLPTCGEWVPDRYAFAKLLTHEANPALGAWGLVGIVAASMSTADGAMLAMGTVWSHNITRQLDKYYPSLITPDNLLWAARLSTIPFTLASTIIAAQVRETGYLLIVAFDIMFAAVVVPLFAAFYCPGKPSPRAAFVSVVAGVVTRVVLEFSMPKDKSYLLPYNDDEFLNYGPAASSKYPVFFDFPVDEVWDPAVEPCEQESFKDYIGVDSLSAFFTALISFVVITTIENCTGKPLFDFAGLKGYEKELGQEDKDATARTRKSEGEEDGSDHKGESDGKEDDNDNTEEQEA